MSESNKEAIEKLRGEPAFQKHLVAVLADYFASERFPQSDEIIESLPEEQSTVDTKYLQGVERKAWDSSQNFFDKLRSFNNLAELKRYCDSVPGLIWPDEEDMAFFEKVTLGLYMEGSTGPAV